VLPRQVADTLDRFGRGDWRTIIDKRPEPLKLDLPEEPLGGDVSTGETRPMICKLAKQALDEGNQPRFCKKIGFKPNLLFFMVISTV
jgi:hypothetical protein